MRVDGAKSGIDYDPSSARKHEAMRRFLLAIRPYLRERYSMGPDMNTTLPEIDSILQTIGIPSAKMAVAAAQGLSLEHFQARYRTLQEKVDGYTLGRRRSGHGVAMACLAALEHLGIPPREARVSLQGFGSLGSGTAISLYRAGVKIIAIADKEKCLLCRNERGINIEQVLEHTSGTLLPRLSRPDWEYDCAEAIFTVPADVMIPAAVENAIDCQRARTLPARAVVEGANLAAGPEAERILNQRGILVVPDFVAGSAGSLSVDGLFGPPEPPSARQVLEHVERRMRAIVSEVIRRSRRDGCTTREAALAICSEVIPEPDSRPYGHFHGNQG